MMAPSIEPIKLTVAFDCGTSTGKGLATWESDEFPFDTVERHYLIPAALQSISQSTYEEPFELGLGNASAESCLLNYVDPQTKEQTFWEMGIGAIEPGRIDAQDRKFEGCLAKVLSFLGYLVRGELKTMAPVELSLGLLLPLDEFGDRHIFAKWVRSTVVAFQHDGVTVSNIKLSKIDIKPEGYGLYSSGGHDSAMVINWGHSDLTTLVFVEGKLSHQLSRTYPLAGMHGFMRRLDFPIAYEIKGAQIISAAGPNLNEKILKDLTQTKGATEMEQLKKAITKARVTFWEINLKKFSSIDLTGLNTVLIGGGTSLYFEEDLNALYKKSFVRPDWGKAITKEFSERFDVKAKSYTPNLFKDVYGFFCTLPGVERYETKAVEVA